MGDLDGLYEGPMLGEDSGVRGVMGEAKWPTEAMIEAGLRAYEDNWIPDGTLDPRGDMREAAKRIYLAMEAARQKEIDDLIADHCLIVYGGPLNTGMTPDEITQAALGPVPSWPK